MSASVLASLSLSLPLRPSRPSWASTAAVISLSPSSTTACARYIVCAVQALHLQTRSRTRAERRRRRGRRPASVGGCCSRADRTTHEQSSPHLRLAQPPPLHQHHHQQHQHQHHHDRSCSWHCHRSVLPSPSPHCVVITTLTQTRSRWRLSVPPLRAAVSPQHGSGLRHEQSAGEVARRPSSSSDVACVSRPPPPDGSVPAAVTLATPSARAMPSTGSVPGCATKRLLICA